MSSVPGGFPFSQVLCHLGKCAFAWEQIRAILEKKYPKLNSSLKLFILLFIPPLSHVSISPLLLLLLLLSQGTQLCAADHFLHCIGLFPSTCALGVSAPLRRLRAVQPPTHSGAFPLSSCFIVRSCDVLLWRGREGGVIQPPARTMRSVLL